MQWNLFVPAANIYTTHVCLLGFHFAAPPLSFEHFPLSRSLYLSLSLTHTYDLFRTAEDDNNARKEALGIKACK